MRRKYSSKRGGVPFDPEGLQLRDECNKPWVYSWKRAVECSDVMRAVITSQGIAEKIEEA
jgi:hypothetical protein